MDQDDEEFYALVGLQQSRCGKILEAQISLKGEIICEKLAIPCGLLSAETGDPRTQCRFCDRFVEICTCDNGVMIELTADPTLAVCSHDEFCRRTKISAELLVDEGPDTHTPSDQASP